MKHRHSGHIGIIEGFAKLDVHRSERTGIPEAILAEGKTNEQVVAAVRRMAETSGIALATRVSDECANAIQRGLGKKFRVERNSLGRTVVVHKKGTDLK